MDDLTFDCSELPCNYISLPVEKFFKLFEKSKCRKCHALKQKVFTVERFGWAQSLYYKCRNCIEIECVCANLTSSLEKHGLRPHATKRFYELTSIIVLVRAISRGTYKCT
jgi:hypothetical protein